MDKYFTFDKGNNALIEEACRWRANDMKGNRKTFYIKEVVKKNDLILNVTEQTKLERLTNFEDRWPCLNCRKAILRVKIYINMGAYMIIKHPAFETTSIIIILLNCVTLAMEDPTSTETSQADNISEWTF